MSALGTPIAPEVWDAVLDQLLLRVTRHNFDTWLRNTRGLRFEGTTLVVGVPNDFARDWLSARMQPVINQATTCVAGPGLSVTFEPVASSPPAGSNGHAPLQPSMLPQHPKPLNMRLTFASFLECGHNQLALTAARDVAGSHDSCYSPLLITGGPGSGKTHLLHAIGHEAAQAGLRFLLVTADEFLSEFTTSVRNRTGAAFRARYRQVDLLLVDDIQRLAGKKATQSEFFQTIACLHDAGRRVVVTCDRSSGACDAAARFQGDLRWGLVADIGEPDLDDRMRFLQAKSAGHRQTIPVEVLQYIALRVKSSLRDLEGAVNRITALSSITAGPIDVDFAARALQPVQVVGQQPALTAEDVLNIVCTQLNVSLPDLKSARRDRSLTYPRHIAMYLLRKELGLTYAAIASMLDRKDHSTVVHACRQLESRKGLCSQTHADIDTIRAVLHATATAA